MRPVDGPSSSLLGRPYAEKSAGPTKVEANAAAFVVSVALGVPVTGIPKYEEALLALKPARAERTSTAFVAEAAAIVATMSMALCVCSWRPSDVTGSELA